MQMGYRFICSCSLDLYDCKFKIRVASLHVFVCTRLPPPFVLTCDGVAGRTARNPVHNQRVIMPPSLMAAAALLTSLPGRSPANPPTH